MTLCGTRTTQLVIFESGLQKNLIIILQINCTKNDRNINTLE